MTPEGYGWTGIDAAGDFNNDGQMDCVAALHPEGEDRQEIWLFISTKRGEHEAKCICATPQLYCRKLFLDGEGRLVLENAIYGANRKDWFSYREGDFFLEKTIQWGYGSKQIRTAKELGEYRMEEYYRDAYFATLAFLEEPSDGPGWEEVEGVREKLVQEIRDTGYSWSIRTEIFPVYENERICSMVAGASGVMLPVVIDKETGNCVQWMELLTKEEFLSICRTGMEPMYGDVKVAEYLKYLEEGYEYINTEEPVTRAMSGKEPIISCYPDARGIRIVFLWMNERKTDCRAEMFHIEKGYFVDTQWWGYLYTGRVGFSHYVYEEWRK